MASAEERALSSRPAAVVAAESPAEMTAKIGADALAESREVDKKVQVHGQQYEQEMDHEQRKTSGTDIAKGEQMAEELKRSSAIMLPPEIIKKILYQADPEAFASAVLSCRIWRNVSEDAKLYAFQLSRLRSDSAQETQLGGLTLATLKQQFAREAKRCLVFPFLRPKITTVSLIAEAPLSSFAAGPGGEKFEFVFSHYARWCLAISSSRIYVIDLVATNGPGVTKELKVLRRPLAADILPDGSVLAVLSSDHSVSLYSVQADKVQLKRSVDLDNVPYTIAMSPGGEILAAAFDGGLELCSLRENALPSEKRSVKTHRVDKLMFSSDGSILLGTTQGRDPATVILTAPYFSPAEYDLTPSELVNSMWTQQILFPTSSRDCSHSTLLPRSADHDSNWTLTYDRTYESFRAVRTDDLRNGTTYFTGPETGTDRRVIWPKDALVPTTLPSTTARGDLVAAGFNRSEVWLYGVPETLDVGPAPHAASQTGLSDENSPLQDQDGLEQTRLPDTEGPPKWQMLVDKYRNVFSKGKKVADIDGVSSMCWFKPGGSHDLDEKVGERLVIAAPGGVGLDTSLNEETPIDGGRLVILDFGLFPGVGERRDMTIELGTKEPQLLEEQKADMETEILRVRRRTLAQRDAARVRSVLDALRPDNALEDVPEVPPLPSMGASNATRRIETPNAEEEDDDGEPGVTLEEAVLFAEGPYSHANPRSRTALYRSATVNQASRRRVQQTRQPDAPAPLPLRRQDGTEVPDESDADNWVPPPPPYQRHANELLPDDLVQRALLYNGIAPVPSTAESMVRPRRSSSLNEGRSQRRRSSVDVDLLAFHLRPARPQVENSVGPGDASVVSSASVTPRSSIRRRPLTVYQSNSSALRESAISRSTSQLGRSPSIGSSRLSRSESLRRTSVPGAEATPMSAVSVAAAAAVGEAATYPPMHSPLSGHVDPILSAPREENENISPTDEPSPASGPVPDLDNEPRLSPDSDMIATNVSGTVPEVESLLEMDPLPEPVTNLQPIQDFGHVAETQTRPEIEPAVNVYAVQESRQEPQHQNYPEEDVNPFFQPVSALAGGSSVIPDSGSRQQTLPAAIPERSVPETIGRPSQEPQELSGRSAPQELATTVQSRRSVEEPISAPSAHQISALQNRPRPHARQLSGGSARGRVMAPQQIPPQVTAVQSPEAMSQAKRNRSKTRRRISQRLRGALRRNDHDSEPMPELPQVPQLYNAAQHSSTGPARHSRMYANQRSNASEPALQMRPQAQRLDTIQSVGSALLRNAHDPPQPSLSHQQDDSLQQGQRMLSVAESERLQAKRTRSIFGRRKSKGNGTGPLVPLDAPPPPVPPLPSNPAVQYHVSIQGGTNAPVPGGLRRAATDYQQSNQMDQGVYTDSHGIQDGRPRTRDKDGKCAVM